MRVTAPQFAVDGAYHRERFLANLPLPAPRATRRAAALLPHDYDRSARDYPVLYLQDGQSLCDEFAPYGKLSPSIWVNPTLIERWPERPGAPTRVYLYGGMRGGDRTTETFARVHAALRAADSPRRRIRLRAHVAPDAEHNEQAWGQAFPRAATFPFG